MDLDNMKNEYETFSYRNWEVKILDFEDIFIPLEMQKFMFESNKFIK